VPQPQALLARKVGHGQEKTVVVARGQPCVVSRLRGGERPVDLSAGRARLEVVLREEILQCCVNGAVCLSTSVYDHAAGRVGLACLDGEATCSSLVVRTRS